MLTKGRSPHTESAMIKVFGYDLFQRILYDCFQIIGLYG